MNILKAIGKLSIKLIYLFVIIACFSWYFEYGKSFWVLVLALFIVQIYPDIIIWNEKRDKK